MDTQTADSTLATPAPAQADAPVSAPETAVDQAVAANDLTAFRTARNAARVGKPLAPAPAAETAEPDADPVTETAGAPERPVSKRQQATNDAIRAATERAVADAVRQRDEEIARLRQQLPQSEPERPAAAASSQSEATPRPRAEDIGTKYETWEQYEDALLQWNREQWAAETRAERDRQAAETAAAERQTRNSERIRAFEEKQQAAKAAHPERVAAIAAGPLQPILRDRLPLSLMEPDQPVDFGNHLAEAIFSADDPLAISEAVADPAVLARLQGSSSVFDFYREIGRLEGRRATPARAADAPPPRTVSTMPAPSLVVGSRVTEPTDPLEAAVGSGDISRFRAERNAQRAARLR